jgi:hypothetical protein
VAIQYPYRIFRQPGFGLKGFTKIVKSGGEMYAETRESGRWSLLKEMASADDCIYGVASFDGECPTDYYRYTLGVKSRFSDSRTDRAKGDLFSFHVKPSLWMALTLEHFGLQYGEFWNADPYRMIRELGHTFNKSLGIHVDVYCETYKTEEDAMEFWMPITTTDVESEDQSTNGETSSQGA